MQFVDADEELQGTLDDLDGASNYAAWIFALMEPYLGAKLLELGAGHGTFTDLLANSGRQVVASDLSERCATVLEERFSNVPNVQVVHGGVDASATYGPFDTAILVNVLEHIEDDDDALGRLYESLEADGRLVLWVPAFEALYSEFDRKVGHFRRYKIAGLRSQLERAGFQVEDLRYANSLGAIAWWVVARMLRRTPTRRASVQVFDRYAVPMVRWFESKRHPPFGQSVFAVAIRPGRPGDTVSKQLPSNHP